MGDNYTQQMRKFWDVNNIETAKTERVCIGDYKHYWDEAASMTKTHYDAIVNGLNIDKTSVGLEYGCGIGRMMKLISKNVKFLHGVDVSGKMIEFNKEYLKDVKNIETMQTNGLDLKVFEDNKFDFVYSILVFMHIPVISVITGILNEMHRVLKNDGLLRVQFSSTGGGYEDAEFNGFNGRVIDLEKGKELLQEAGFEITDTQKGIGMPWYTWFTAIKK